jgi:hypothetical protein
METRVTKILKIIATIAVALTATTALAQPVLRVPPLLMPPPSPPERLVTHNDSLMAVTQDNAGFVRIIYRDPRPSLQAIGIFPGVLLIQGRWVAPNKFVGFANVFACGQSWPYQVQGGIAPDGVLLLEGPAPIITVGWGCGLSGYTWDSGNAHLAFLPYRIRS